MAKRGRPPGRKFEGQHTSLYLTQGLRQMLKDAAVANRCGVSAEIRARLEDSFKMEKPTSQVFQAIESHGLLFVVAMIRTCTHNAVVKAALWDAMTALRAIEED